MSNHIKWNSEMSPDKRCQAVTGMGQCLQCALENAKYCASHGGNKGQQAAERKSLNMYRVQKYQEKIRHFEEHDKIKGLRSEIGILRMMLEEKLNACSSEMELMLASGPVSDLVMKIEKLVVSCHKIENQLGNLLDRQKVQVLASMLLQTVDAKIKNTSLPEKQQGDFLEGVAEDFLKHLSEIQ